MAAPNEPLGFTWPLNYGPCDDCTAINGLDQEGQDVAEQVAIGLLWRWTGRAFGTRTVTVDLDPTSASSWSTYRGRGGSPRALLLPAGLRDVTAVAVDGVPVLSFESDGQVLTWAGSGGGCDPLVTVTGTFGAEVPAGGQVAAATLACELAKALCGDTTCSLPERVQTVTRQGISMTLLDSFDDLDTGKTGIWIVDSWVSSVMKSPLRSVVASPDSRRLSRLR